MVDHSRDNQLETWCHTNNKLGEYLINKDIGEHESKPEHDRNIENTHKILISVQTKHSIFNIEGELVATEKISERY